MYMEKRKKSGLLLCFLTAICFITILVCNIAIADIFTRQEMLSTDWRALDTFIWQDFEYWHAPANYGWKSSCPAYPNFGF
jgi:hypothetical protein